MTESQGRERGGFSVTRREGGYAPGMNRDELVELIGLERVEQVEAQERVLKARAGEYAGNVSALAYDTFAVWAEYDEFTDWTYWVDEASARAWIQGELDSGARKFELFAWPASGPVSQGVTLGHAI